MNKESTASYLSFYVVQNTNRKYYKRDTYIPTTLAGFVVGEGDEPGKLIMVCSDNMYFIPVEDARNIEGSLEKQDIRPDVPWPPHIKEDMAMNLVASVYRFIEDAKRYTFTSQKGNSLQYKGYRLAADGTMYLNFASKIGRLIVVKVPLGESFWNAIKKYDITFATKTSRVS